MSSWYARGSFRLCRMRKQCLSTLRTHDRTHFSRAFPNSYVFFAPVMSSWRKKLPSACTIWKRNTEYSCKTCGKSVCVRVECSTAEEKEDTFFGWDANRSAGYCLPCAGAAAGAWQSEFCSENCHYSDDIEPVALENEFLDEERSDIKHRTSL